MHSLFFEDLEPGTRWRPPGRTVTEADVIAFTAVSGDSNPVHTDGVFAASGPFGERIAHGLLGLAMAGGFLSRVGVVDGSAVALLGVEWSFRAPVRFGDTLAAEITVRDKRESRDQSRGIVNFGFSIVNQDGTLVQEGTHTFMVSRKPAAAAD